MVEKSFYSEQPTEDYPRSRNRKRKRFIEDWNDRYERKDKYERNERYERFEKIEGYDRRDRNDIRENYGRYERNERNFRSRSNFQSCKYDKSERLDNMIEGRVSSDREYTIHSRKTYNKDAYSNEKNEKNVQSHIRSHDDNILYYGRSNDKSREIQLKHCENSTYEGKDKLMNRREDIPNDRISYSSKDLKNSNHFKSRYDIRSGYKEDVRIGSKYDDKAHKNLSHNKGNDDRYESRINGRYTYKPQKEIVKNYNGKEISTNQELSKKHYSSQDRLKKVEFYRKHSKGSKKTNTSAKGTVNKSRESSNSEIQLNELRKSKQDMKREWQGNRKTHCNKNDTGTVDITTYANKEVLEEFGDDHQKWDNFEEELEEQLKHDIIDVDIEETQSKILTSNFEMYYTHLLHLSNDLNTDTYKQSVKAIENDVVSLIQDAAAKDSQLLDMMDAPDITKNLLPKRYKEKSPDREDNVKSTHGITNRSIPTEHSKLPSQLLEDWGEMEEVMLRQIRESELRKQRKQSECMNYNEEKCESNCKENIEPISSQAAALLQMLDIDFEDVLNKEEIEEDDTIMIKIEIPSITALSEFSEVEIGRLNQLKKQ